ncbi:MAG TPA: EAL domain-containing protein [Solirubrobacteraceae bacterium]|nr:EAL domain-containing protein [Solirubrobacteraceae bacterium]
MVAPARTRSFAQRLIASLAMMVLPLLILAGVQLGLGRQAADRSARTAREIITESGELSGARNEMRQLEAVAAATYFKTEGARLELDEQRQRTVAAIDAIDSFDTADERLLIAQARSMLVSAFAELRAVRGAGTPTVAQLGRFHTKVVAADMALGQTERLSLAEVQQDADADAAERRRTTLLVVALLLLNGLIAAFLARRMRRDLRVGLLPLREAARRVGSGDLHHRIASQRDDELGDLADAFDAMAESTLAAHDRLLHQARHDALTGLPNRSVLVDRVQHAAARAVRDRPGLHLGVVLIGLDGFKALNDTVGHSAGDALLQTAAQRLSAQLRPGDTVARLGGDEFGVLLEELDDPAEAMAVTERLVAALDQPLDFEGRLLRVTASAGVRTVPAVGADADELLRDADVAMAQAKADGAGSHRVFEPWMQQDVARRVGEVAELRTAIADGQLELRHQPIVRLGDEGVAGVEALVRWQHPERGLVPPGDFIPLAEETGLVVDLGAWVLTQAVEELRALNAALAEQGEPARYVSVNVSPRQLRDPRFFGLVADAVARLGDRGDLLMLEVTEHAFVGDADEARVVLERCRALGVRVAIDDFGTGWSSLAYLRRLPVDVLKIDRSFLTGDEPALVEAIVGLARTLGLRTVAEGIEERAQLDLLRALGCDHGQGYLFARPLPLEDLLPPLGAAAA